MPIFATARQQHSFPPRDAEFLVRRWRDLGRPEIPLDRTLPGYIVTDLERLFQFSSWPPDRWQYEQVNEIRAFLLAGERYRGRTPRLYRVVDGD
jgi:hypothetical protein